MLHALPCILCYPRELFTFFLFLLFLLHPHPPTIQLQNSFTLHIIMLLLLELASHMLLPLARDAKITCCCAFFLPEAFSWKKSYQAISRMCSKWGLSFFDEHKLYVFERVAHYGGWLVGCWCSAVKIIRSYVNLELSEVVIGCSSSSIKNERKCWTV